MDLAKVEETLKDIVADITFGYGDEMTREFALGAGQDMTSDDMREMRGWIEDDFNLKFTPADAEACLQVKNFGELVDLVAKAVNQVGLNAASGIE